MSVVTECGKARVGLFFSMALGLTWLFWIPDALGKRGVLPDALWTNLGFIGAFGPLLAALFMVYSEQGGAGVRHLLKKAVERAFGGRWWAVVFLLYPCLIAVGYVVAVSVDGVTPPSEASGLYWFLPFIFFSVMFTGGPLQEEFGWRGYALPRLQARFSPFVSSLVLGCVWAVWHFPQFLVPAEKTGMFYTTPFWSFALTVMAASFVYTWVYNRTGGSILGVLVLHTQMNLSFWVFPVLSATTGYLWILGLFALAGGLAVVLDRTSFFSKPSVPKLAACVANVQDFGPRP